MAQRNPVPDHDAWANAIVRHPVFAEIGEKTRDGSNTTQDGSNASSNASNERRRQVFKTTDAELASVWRGKTVRGSSTSSRSTSSQSSKRGTQRSSREDKAKRRLSSVIFAKDIVLLRSHTDRTVPTSSKRAELHRQGFILNLFEIDTAWAETELIERIKDEYLEKLEYGDVG